MPVQNEGISRSKGSIMSTGCQVDVPLTKALAPLCGDVTM